jgi:small subunit ribosomal protein S3
MGQKVNPIGFRVGVTTGWNSKWYAEKDYKVFVEQDLKIRRWVKAKLGDAGISKVVIERTPGGNARVLIHAAKPGFVLGKRSTGLDALRTSLQALSTSTVYPNIIEVRKVELDATLVAENIAQQLEKRVSFRRAMKKAMQQSRRAGARGIKVMCSGRLGGAEMSRCEWYMEGRVPLHTLRADIDFGRAEAHTTYGAIGVKVWIFKGELIGGEPAPA